MKAMKKLFALLLALTMVFGLAATGFAAAVPEKGTITITNTVKDIEYTIYRIFDLESYDVGSEAYSYKVNTAWESFARSDAAKAYITVDAQGYVTWTGAENDAAYVAFAKLALENKPASDAGISQTSIADASTLTFSDLDLGYYLVDTSLGALCGLTTTKPNATVIEKNAKPTVDKEVKEGNSWGSKNDANIGDTVNFQTTITVEGFASGYVLHDTMSKGLTYGTVTGVTLNDTAVAPGSYTVIPNATHTAEDETKTTCTFDVVFTEDFCKTLKSGDKIVVSYNAVLNAGAVVSGANENETKLEYKDNAGDTHETEEDKTETFTWEVDIIKYTGEQADPDYLEGAKFVLHKDTKEGALVNFVQDASNENLYKVCTKDDEVEGTHDHVTEITTDESGRFNLEGLDAGTYYLEETDAPEGYNKLADMVEVIINHEGKVTQDKKELTNTEIWVLNKTGTELPSTGGMGTTLFYVLGSVMVIGAAVILVSKKRVNQ